MLLVSFAMMIYAGIILLLLVWLVLKVVPEGSVFTLTRLGKLKKVLGPGPHLIIPLVDRVTASVNLCIQTLDLPAHTSYSRDGTRHSISLTVVFCIKDPVKVSYGVKDLKKILSVLSYKAINKVMAACPSQEVMSSRNRLTALFAADLARSVAGIGVEIIETDIRDIEVGKARMTGRPRNVQPQGVNKTQTVVEMKSSAENGAARKRQGRQNRVSRPTDATETPGTVGSAG